MCTIGSQLQSLQSQRALNTLRTGQADSQWQLKVGWTPTQCHLPTPGRSCSHSNGCTGDRQSWDFGRFVKTVTYFNDPPTPEKVLQTLVEQPAKFVRQLTGQDEVSCLSGLSVGNPGPCRNYNSLHSLLFILPSIHAEFVLMQEKQNAVLKLLASSSSQTSKPNTDVVLVAGDCLHICTVTRHTVCVSVKVMIKRSSQTVKPVRL